MREFEANVSFIPGLFGERHSKLVYGLVRSLRPMVAVEVGCWRGHMSCWIAKAMQDNGVGELHLIDNFSLPGGSAANLHNALVKCGVAERAIITDGLSSEATWPIAVDFAYIDGDHSYEGCAKDVQLAISRGAKCICIHDTVSWWGPRQVLDELEAQEQSDWQHINFNYDEGLAVLLKKTPKPPLTHAKEFFPSGIIT